MPQDDVDPDVLLTCDELAHWLRQSRTTIQRRVRDRELPHLRLHGAVRFRRADIERFLDDATVQPVGAAAPTTVDHDLALPGDEDES